MNAVSDPELEHIADELYALRPDDFAAARDEQVRKARADGKPPLARELARLRKPMQSAWLINLLWRDQHDVMEQLFQLADELSQAQAQAAGPALQSLTTQRRQLEATLLRHARGLADKAGVTVSAAMEREAQETLSAALAVPEVANELRTGRLVKPAAYAGFGTLPAAGMHKPASDAEASVPPTPAPVDLRAVQRARERREAAERQVAEARAAVEAAHQHHEALEQQLRQLKTQVAAAEKTHEEARVHLERSEAELKELVS
jgi:hypothetical protein